MPVPDIPLAPDLRDPNLPPRPWANSGIIIPAGLAPDKEARQAWRRLGRPLQSREPDRR